MTPETKLFKAIMKASGMTQKEIAEKSNMAQPHISRYSTGEVSPPLKKIYAIAEKVGVTITFKIEKKVSETVKI